MFETGMSALVLKICSEYAKSLGLNFPPCTQQEINAICQWVDKHTVKDLTMEQNGDSVTFRFVTENDTTKEFTFTIPEQKVDVNVLEQLLIGSNTVVVERTEDNSKLQVRLAQSVLNDINNKLTKPANPTSDSVVTMTANGTVGTKPLSGIGGGKLYRHDINITFDEYYFNLYTVIYSTINIAFNYDNLLENLGNMTNCVYNGSNGIGAVALVKASVNEVLVSGAVATGDNSVFVVRIGAVNLSSTSIRDTITEL